LLSQRDAQIDATTHRPNARISAIATTSCANYMATTNSIAATK
jgi:hypothetical protein